MVLRYCAGSWSVVAKALGVVVLYTLLGNVLQVAWRVRINRKLQIVVSDLMELGPAGTSV